MIVAHVMFANAFLYETLHTPGELPAGFIIDGEDAWKANEARITRWRRIARFLHNVFTGGWRA